MFSRITLVVLFFGVAVLGHSYITTLTTSTTSAFSRSNQKQTNSGCRGPACLGPCDLPLSGNRLPPTPTFRGDRLNIKWPRNNHAGGFIRFAWAQTSGSDVHSNFDNMVQVINCHEVGGCRPDDASNPNGGDSGSSDGTVRPCQWDLTVPLHLSDGNWTLQWAWFGGAFALGDYYSCVDFTISGGNNGAQLAPAFVGGDYSYPGQNKCKFFNTDRLHVCISEPCNTPIYTGEQSGPAFGFSGGSPVSTQRSITSASITSSAMTSKSITSASITSKAMTTAAVQTTTKSAATTKSTPQTTASITSKSVTSSPQTTSSFTSASMTTSPVSSKSLSTATVTTKSNAVTTKSAPVTTRVQPVTTKAKVVTTRMTVLTTNNPNTPNCASLNSAIPSSILAVSIESVDSWDSGFRVYFKMDVYGPISNWAVELIWPTGLRPDITDVSDTVIFDCESDYPNSHVVFLPASYVNDLSPPNQVYFEVETSSGNVDPTYLANNIQIKVFRQ